MDRVIGLEVGADDYITKPFHLREVLARFRSVLRRSGSRQSTVSEQNENGDDDDGEHIEFAGWRLDLVGRNLHAPDKSLVLLTTGEFNIWG